MEFDVLLMGGPGAGQTYRWTGGKAIVLQVEEADGQIAEHYYRPEPMKFMGDKEAQMVVFALYGRMTIEEALQELWAAYVEQNDG